MLTIPGLADVAARLDVEHRTGVAVLGNGQGHAYAVVVAATGEVLASDGWHAEDRPAGAVDLRRLPWDDGQGTPPEVLHRANAPWLGGPLGSWLMPTYCPAHEAHELLHAHAHDGQPDPALRDAELLAYLPIVDPDGPFS